MNNPDIIMPFQRDDKTIFDEPWHAQVLAVADGLLQSGQFSPDQWATALGAARKSAELRNDPDIAETYYQCALSALETLLAQRSKISIQAISQRSEAWAQAYLKTPHGQPVLLPSAAD